jgi:5'-3' exonuclease
MGIVNLNQVLKQYCPEQLITYSLSELPGLIMAVDISVFLYKYIRTAGTDRWIDSFLMMLRCFKKYRIKVVCIFDGPNPPKEKKTEQECRRAETDKIKTKLDVAKKLLVKVNELIDDGLTENYDEKFQAEVKLLLAPKVKKVDSTLYDDIYDVRESLQNAVARWSLQTIPISPEHKQQAKDLIEYLGLAMIQADGEAETLCAQLCVKGKIDAVLTEDTDVLAYGTPLAFFRLDLQQETVVGIHMPSVLTSLSMDIEEFRDMCILLTCDYNKHSKKLKGVKGYPPDGKKHKKPVGIGWKNAYLMIREYRRLEEVENYLVDASALSYHVCRELFGVPDDVSLDVVPYNREIDKKRLQTFLEDCGCKISMKYICQVWDAGHQAVRDEGSREI